MKRRKKSVKKKNQKPKITEMNGYEAGQSVYCNRYPDNVFCRGVITQFFVCENQDVFEFLDDATGQFRLALLKEIVKNPTRKQIGGVNLRISIKNRKSKEKEKKSTKKM